MKIYTLFKGQLSIWRVLHGTGRTGIGLAAFFPYTHQAPHHLNPSSVGSVTHATLHYNVPAIPFQAPTSIPLTWLLATLSPAIRLHATFH